MAAVLRGAALSVLLQQFARLPVPGRVKTRMQPVLSAEQACALHEALVLWTSRRLLQAGLGTVELWAAGGVDHPLFRRCLGEGVSQICLQRGDDLGDRMQYALASGLRRAAAVLLVGSDCPEIDAGYLRAATRALQHVDLVLGPALDGGFVLIGVRRPVSDGVFTNVRWGSETVLEETLNGAQAAGYSVQLLTALQDIDRPEDLPAWEGLQATVDPAVRR